MQNKSVDTRADSMIELPVINSRIEKIPLYSTGQEAMLDWWEERHENQELGSGEELYVGAAIIWQSPTASQPSLLYCMHKGRRDYPATLLDMEYTWANHGLPHVKVQGHETVVEALVQKFKEDLNIEITNIIGELETKYVPLEYAESDQWDANLDCIYREYKLLKYYVVTISGDDKELNELNTFETNNAKYKWITEDQIEEDEAPTKDPVHPPTYYNHDADNSKYDKVVELTHSKWATRAFRKAFGIYNGYVTRLDTDRCKIQ